MRSGLWVLQLELLTSPVRGLSVSSQPMPLNIAHNTAVVVLCVLGTTEIKQLLSLLTASGSLLSRVL